MEILINMKKNKKHKKIFSRFYWFYIALAAVMLIIISRLLYLQIVMVDEYRDQSNSNSYKTVSLTAARGDIVDTNGKKFATSIQSYVLEYNETDESKKVFFSTIKKVLKVLDENSIPLVDEFPIVLNEDGSYTFNFQSSTEEGKKWYELRFKKDRGFDETVAKKLYGSSTRLSALSDEQKEAVDAELLKISAEDAYKTLEKQYKLDTDEEYMQLSEIDKRRFLLIKDAINIGRYSDDPVVIANNIKEETAFIFQQQLSDLPGINVDTKPMRYYPEKELGSSFLGYMSSINPWEQDKYEEQGYDVSSDEIGASGIEAAYESYLKGTKGQQRIQINSQGRTVRVLGEVEAYAGDTVQLNIDMNIQKVLESSLDETLTTLQEKGKNSNDADTTNATRGAAVAIKTTGEIVGIASRPGYDPNIFTTPGLMTTELYNHYFSPDLEEMGRTYIKARGLASKEGLLTKEQLSTLSEDERIDILMDKMFPIDDSIEGNTTIREDVYDVFPKSFYNYATMTRVPPGSTFKPVTALAGLEEGVIDEDTLITDAGEYGKYGFKGACWIYTMYNRHGSHGAIDVEKALEVSCNYFFYDVADRLYNKTHTVESLNIIAKYGWSLGLGIPYGSDEHAGTGIEISENFGQVYNYESNKVSKTNLYINQLADYLKKGIRSTNSTPHYTPIDITQAAETGKGKELQKIKNTNEKKKALVDAIKTEMQADEEQRTPDAELVRKLTALIKDVIDSDEDLTATGYSDDDIEGMCNAMIQAVIDARVEITSPANAYSAAIGQGLNTFTPLQIASYISTLINGGTRYEAKLVDKIIDSETGEVIEDIQPKIISQANFDPKNIETIKRGMKEVTEGESGTAAAIFDNFPIKNGGKTGTSNIIDESIDDAVGRDAAGLYVGFAPYDDPEIVVCSIIFDGGHGKGNIAKDVFEEYFRDRIKEINPDYKFKYNFDEN